MRSKLIFQRLLRVRIIAADPYALLDKCSGSGLVFRDIQEYDLLTLELTVSSRKYPELQRIVTSAGGICRIKEKIGVVWSILTLMKRPLLITGFLITLILSVFLSDRILFVRVVGMEHLSERQIQEVAEECGIGFGSKRHCVRSEDVKNKMLQRLPQLQWIGINTNGCVATLQVKERSKGEQAPALHLRICSIYASRDGIISDMTILKGTPLCAVGQSVHRGQLLVSGYADCGLKLVAQQAEGEIYAFTFRNDTVLALHSAENRGAFVDRHCCYKLKIGKKVINLWNHSGISDATCVKMYSENYLCLPGGFHLPVSIITEEALRFDSVESPSVNVSDFAWMKDFYREYSHAEMVSGRIIRTEYETLHAEGVTTLCCRSICNEMIGQIKYEELLEKNAKDY